MALPAGTELIYTEPGEGPLPLVQVVHGGPHGTSADSFHPRWNVHLFAAPGYVAALKSAFWTRMRRLNEPLVPSPLLQLWVYTPVLAFTENFERRLLCWPFRFDVYGSVQPGWRYDGHPPPPGQLPGQAPAGFCRAQKPFFNQL